MGVSSNPSSAQLLARGEQINSASGSQGPLRDSSIRSDSRQSLGYCKSFLARALEGDQIPFQVTGKVNWTMQDSLSAHQSFARLEFDPQDVNKIDFVNFGGRPRQGAPGSWDNPRTKMSEHHRVPQEKPDEHLRVDLYRAAMEVFGKSSEARDLNLPVGVIVFECERAPLRSASGRFKGLSNFVTKLQAKEPPLNVTLTTYLPSQATEGTRAKRVDTRNFVVQFSLQFPAEQAQEIERELQSPEGAKTILLSLLAYPPDDSAVGEALSWLKQGALEPTAQNGGKSLEQSLLTDFVVGRKNDPKLLSDYQAALRRVRS
ncbi:MAG: hypothetical protein KDD64_11560 [Bdellovibrionales bacterium]|nr:hypothetical protein [Bdellovibrionales bacterium]